MQIPPASIARNDSNLRASNTQALPHSKTPSTKKNLGGKRLEMPTERGVDPTALPPRVGTQRLVTVRDSRCRLTPGSFGATRTKTDWLDLSSGSMAHRHEHRKAGRCFSASATGAVLEHELQGATNPTDGTWSCQAHPRSPGLDEHDGRLPSETVHPFQGGTRERRVSGNSPIHTGISGVVGLDRRWALAHPTSSSRALARRPEPLSGRLRGRSGSNERSRGRPAENRWARGLARQSLVRPFSTRSLAGKDSPQPGFSQISRVVIRWLHRLESQCIPIHEST